MITFDNISEVDNYYTDEEENVTYIDAYTAEEEEGMTVAKVCRDTKKVFYKDQIFKHSPAVQEAIQEVLDDIGTTALEVLEQTDWAEINEERKSIELILQETGDETTWDGITKLLRLLYDTTNQKG